MNFASAQPPFSPFVHGVSVVNRWLASLYVDQDYRRPQRFFASSPPIHCRHEEKGTPSSIPTRPDCIQRQLPSGKCFGGFNMQSFLSLPRITTRALFLK
jgi:hypothetical protein